MPFWIDERFRNRGKNVRNAGVVRYAGGAAVATAAKFTRPANTTPYAPGQIVAGSPVVPLEFVCAREYASTFLIIKGRLWKSSANLAGAAFVLHLFKEKPTVLPADGAAFLTNKSACYLGGINLFDFLAFSDGAMGVGAPTADGPISVELGVPDESASDQIKAAARTVYGLLEVRGNYTPASGEQFEVALELQQD